MTEADKKTKAKEVIKKEKTIQEFFDELLRLFGPSYILVRQDAAGVIYLEAVGLSKEAMPLVMPPKDDKNYIG